MSKFDPRSSLSKDAAKTFMPRPASDPVTKAEMHLRAANRPKPTLQHVLTPDGHVTRQVHLAVDVENERRIRFIHKRLEQHRSKARDDFNRNGDR